MITIRGRAAGAPLLRSRIAVSPHSAWAGAGHGHRAAGWAARAGCGRADLAAVGDVEQLPAGRPGHPCCLPCNGRYEPGAAADVTRRCITGGTSRRARAGPAAARRRSRRSGRCQQPGQGGGQLLLPPEVVMPADPLLMAAGKTGALQALRPLPGRPAEPGLERPGGEVVADAGRAGAAGEPLRDDPGAERGHAGEDVRAALRGADRPGAAVGETRGNPGPVGRAEVTGRPGDDLAGDEVKMRPEATAAVAREVLLATPVGPRTGR